MMDILPYVAAFIAIIGYGSYVVPVKRFDVQDGAVYQWFVCCGIMIGGVAGALLRNNWGAEDMISPGFYVAREGLFSGFLWQSANVICTWSVRDIGLGNYYIWHELTNLGGSFIIGVLGPSFGIPAQAPSNVGLATLGIGCVFLAMVPVAFMRCEEAAVSGGAGVQRSALCVNADATPALSTEESRVHLSFAGGIPACVETGRPVRDHSVWVQVRGIVLALLCGVLLACQYEPMIPWRHRIQSAGYTVGGFDYVFSTCLGIFICSSAWLALTGAWRRIQRQPLFKPVLRPAIFAGLMWAASCHCQLYAMSVMPYAVAYCAIVGGGLGVSLLWGVCVFGEAADPYNRKCLAVIFSGIFVGIVLLGLST